MSDKALEKVKERINDTAQNLMLYGAAGSSVDTASAHIGSAIKKLEKVEETEMKEDLEEAQALINKVSEELRYKKTEINEEHSVAKDKKAELEHQQEIEEKRTEAEEKLNQIIEQAKKQEEEKKEND